MVTWKPSSAATARYVSSSSAEDVDERQRCGATCCPPWFRSQQLRCVVPILMPGASDALFNVLLSCSSWYLRMSASVGRQGILTTTDYINLTQCENLEDVRMHLTVRGAPFSLLQASRGSRWRSAWLRRASACVRKCSSAQSSAVARSATHAACCVPHCLTQLRSHLVFSFCLLSLHPRSRFFCRRTHCFLLHGL